MANVEDVDFNVLNEEIELTLTTLQSELTRKQESGTPLNPDFFGLHEKWNAAKQLRDPAAIKALYDAVEFTICGTDVENFQMYETCFAALNKIGCYLGPQDSMIQENLVTLLVNINEIYDVLLNCVETYEWVQPGVTGLLRMYMLQTLFYCVGFDQVTGRHLMELTNNDVAGAVSLVCFVIRCGDCSFAMQQTAGRCLVDLTTADAVFFRDERLDEDYNSQDIAKLTQMLNRHVNGLIMSIIEFELVDAFGRCICQHQQSHSRTDVIVKAFLTALHNCLLYCSENQKKLRMHLSTQSTIIQDIMFPYVDNILPALYENPSLTLDAIEYQNLRAALQTFVVITFNINVFRSHFEQTDFLIRITEAPLVLGSIAFIELLIKLMVNCDFVRSKFKTDLMNLIEQSYNALPEDKRKRLKRRLNETSGHSLPMSRSNVRTMQELPFLFDNIPDPTIAASKPDVENSRNRNRNWRNKRVRKSRKFGMQWVRKKEKDGLGMRSSDEDSGDENSVGAGYAGGGGPNSSSEQGLENELNDQLNAQFNAPVQGNEHTQTGGAGAGGQQGLCQLSGLFMVDPVRTPYGHTFDRQALADWLQFSQTDPICAQPLTLEQCVPVTELQTQNLNEQLAAMACDVLGAENVPITAEPAKIVDPSSVEDVEQCQGNNMGVAPGMTPGMPTDRNEYAKSDLTNLSDLPDLTQPKKEKKQKEKIKIASRSLIDAPEMYRCAIDGKVMTNPIYSPYGHRFEKKTIEKWIASCGSVCPITQKPLRITDCQPDKEMKNVIVAWLKENMQG